MNSTTATAAPVDFGPSEDRELRISDLDRSLQVRTGTNTRTVDLYAERIAAGDRFPAPVVFEDGVSRVVADGQHTVAARERVEGATAPITCRVYKGTRRDAFLYAAQANANHGLPRSAQDKRRIVEMVLADMELATTWSSRRIAEYCHVSHTLVDEVRKAKGVEGERSDDQCGPTPPVREGLDRKKRRLPNTSKTATGNGCQLRPATGRTSSGPSTKTAPKQNDEPASNPNGEPKPGSEGEYDVAVSALLDHRDLRQACVDVGLAAPPEMGRVKVPEGLRDRRLRAIDEKQEHMIAEIQEERDAVAAATTYIERYNATASTQAFRNLARRIRQLRRERPRSDFLGLVRTAARELEEPARPPRSTR